MSLRPLFTILLLALPLVLVAGVVAGHPALADESPHAGVFRDPDVSATHVVFVYGDDLWIVAREGGLATSLASPEGLEGRPRFSPDGRHVAFTATYDGRSEIYTLPIEGGVPHRVTWHPGQEELCDWAEDGRLVFSMRGADSLPRQTQLYTVAPEGGLPVRLPVPYGRGGALHPDGTRLVYNPRGGVRPNWKRYRGGLAPDLWLVNTSTHASRRLTEWEGADVEPMWVGESVYFVSDAGPAHHLNVWRFDLGSGERAQITNFRDRDVRWAAVGPGPRGEGEIVLHEGTGLYLVDLATGRPTHVPVQIPGARPALRPQAVDASQNIRRQRPSPTGKRVIVEARGDLWSLPARHGSARNLTRTSGVAERDPAWSPDGKWIAYFADASGEYDLYLLSADGKGEPRRLTTDAAAFRFDPYWSPDSKRIAFTDKAAVLWIHEIESGTTTRVDADPWVESEGVYRPSWSPDSRWLAYSRARGRSINHAIHIHDTTTGKTRAVTSDVHDDRWPAFDREGNYLFYVSNRHFQPAYDDNHATFVYAGTHKLVAASLRADVKPLRELRSDEEEIDGDDEAEADAAETEDDESGGDGEEPETAPAVDDGLSGTWKGTATGEPLPSPVTFTLNVDLAADGTLTGSISSSLGGADVTRGSYDAASGHLLLVLADEDGILWTVKGVVKADRLEGTVRVADYGLELDVTAERTSPGAETAETKKGAGKRDQGAVDPVEIEFDDFERRALVLSVEAGRFEHLVVNDAGAVLYLRRTPNAGRRSGAKLASFDPTAEKPKEQELADGLVWFDLTADGKRVLLIREGGAALRSSSGGGDEKAVSKAGMTAWIEPRAEWRHLLVDAWRTMRDYFYVENMHGLDWPAVRDRYVDMVDDCATREDVSHLIAEMIGELNVGHANYWSSPPWRRGGGSPVGMLGVDWSLENNAYRVRRIVRGASWDVDERGPLERPGTDVHEGDYVLAVNGVPVDVTRAPWAAFEGLAGRTIHLTVSAKPLLDDEARDVLVEPAARENGLRYRAWIEANRRHVEERTNGRVGYVYVPDTGRNGQNELVRQLQGQRNKDALIIDERWNGGGQIPTRFVEMLNRPLRNYYARRDGQDWPWPYVGHQGPKCMLMNGDAGSGGDAFPWYFRQSGLGKLVGMRTWGGLVGMSGNPSLIDGTYMSVPTFGFYELDGTWGIEGHGVDPDIEVIDDPALMWDGGDPQLDAAIELMLEEMKTYPYKPARRPVLPDRRGMGLPEDER